MRTRSLLLASAAGLLTIGIAVPASAAVGVTAAAVTVTAGTLEITVPVAGVPPAVWDRGRIRPLLA